jgi:hypothetical protein
MLAKRAIKHAFERGRGASDDSAQIHGFGLAGHNGAATWRRQS